MPCHLAQANGSPRDSPRLRRPHWYDAVPRQRLRRCAARRAREEHRTSRTTPAQPAEQAKGTVLAVGPRCARAACAPHRWNAVPRRLRRKRAAGRIGEEPRTTCTAPAQPSATASCAQPAREARAGREDSLRGVRARRPEFLCAGRAGFPKILQNFRAIFCAKFPSSRRWTRALSFIRTHADSEKSCSEALRFAQPCWPSSRNFCARGAPIFFGNFAILSRELGSKFASSRR